MASMNVDLTSFVASLRALLAQGEAILAMLQPDAVAATVAPDIERAVAAEVARDTHRDEQSPQRITGGFGVDMGDRDSGGKCAHRQTSVRPASFGDSESTRVCLSCKEVVTDAA